MIYLSLSKLKDLKSKFFPRVDKCFIAFYNPGMSFHERHPATLPQLVSFDTVNAAGFNYWEPSLMISTKRGTPATVWHSQIEDGTNIVIIEDIRRAGGQTRVDWYFGTFEGKHSGQCETDDELKEYYRKLEGVMTRPHRVSGHDLEKLVQRAAGLDI
jgi:hypothetical protein